VSHRGHGEPSQDTVRRTGPRRATCAPRQGRQAAASCAWARPSRATPGHAERRAGSTPRAGEAGECAPHHGGHREQPRCEHAGAALGVGERAGASCRVGRGPRPGVRPRAPGHGRGEQGPRKKKGAAGKGREMGRLTAEDEAARTNDAGAGAAPGCEGDLGRRERDMRRGGEGDEQGMTGAMTGGSHQGGCGGCNRPRMPRLGNAGGGGSRLGRAGRAGPRQLAGPRESEGARGRPRASRPKTGWAVREGKEEGVKQAVAGPKGERERFSFFYFLLIFLLSNLSVTSYKMHTLRKPSNYTQKEINAWFSMMEQPKKIFPGFTYTRCRANSR
jgi:hypothetical protein